MKFSKTVLSLLWFPLFLLSLAWTWLAVLRRWLPDRRYRPAVPAICIGNLTMGGSGKTPLVAAIAAHFRSHRPAILSRGYKGSSEKTGAKVDLAAPDGARLFGDEPWMLAHQTGVPVYVGRDRAKSARAAEADGAGLLIFDDGFQNRGVRYTRSVLLAADVSRPGNAYSFPLGNLREPLSAGRLADVIVTPGDGKLERHSEGPFDERGNAATPPPGRFGAFCGVGDPESFFRPFRDRGLLAFERPFPDHYWYTASDFEELNRAGEALGLVGWITTEKDWYRLHDVRREIRLPLLWWRLTVRLGHDFLKVLDVFGDSK